MKDKNKQESEQSKSGNILSGFFPDNTDIFNKLVMNSPDGTVVTDLMGKILWASPQIFALVGTKEEVVKRETTIMDWVDPSYREKVMENFSKVFQGVFEQNNEYLLIKKDKTRFFGAINSSPLIGNDGKPFGLIATVRDISYLKQIEQELRQSETKYRLLFESANDAIFLMDNHLFMECNSKTLEIFGCTKEEIIGKPPYLFSPPEQPDGQKSETKALHLIKAAMDGTPQLFEWKHKKLNGTLFDAEVNLDAIEIHGKKYLQAIVRDITEWHKTNDHLKTFNQSLLSFGADCMENINRLVIVCGQVLGGDCALYNCLHEGLLCSLGQWNTPEDYISKDSAEGHICFDVINGNLDEVMLIRDLPNTRYFETDPNVRKFGLKTYMGVAVRFGLKTIGSLCVVFQRDFIPDQSDILFLSLVASAIGVEEQRKSALDQLVDRAGELKELITEKDKFFSIIAHDLKGPFNAIMGFSEILTSEWTDFSEEEKLHFIRNIHTSSKNTFQLLENLLEWSMAQTGRLVFTPEPIDLSVIANEIMILLRTQAEKKQIRLFSAINFGTLVTADENMVKTIFRNLVTNAIKFTPSGGQVRINATNVPKHPGGMEMIEACILDNGIGIPAEDLPRIFKIEEKIHSSGTAQERGTGLGLILCKELVEKNGGKIRVESQVDKGSKFCFTLPKAF